MHSSLLHLGPLAIPIRAVLVAVGLLLGVQLSSRVAARFAIDPDRIWGLSLASIAVYFFGARLLVMVCNFADFRAHPPWMLGLFTIRDERYLYAALGLAVCAGVSYMSAWRLPWRRTLDALAPGAGLALAAAAFSDHRVVLLLAVGLPLAPAALALGLALRNAPPGDAAAVWLFGAGLCRFLFEQLALEKRAPVPLFSAAQALCIAAIGLAAFLSFSEPGPAERA